MMESLQSSLVKAVYQSNFKRNQWLPLVAAVVYPFWGLFDFFMGEPLWKEYVAIRFATLPFLIFPFLFKNKSWYFKAHMKVLAFCIAIVSVGVIAMIVTCQHPMDYLIGFSCVFIGANVVSTMELKYYLPAIFVSLIGFALYGNQIDPEKMQTTTLVFFLPTIFILTSLGTYIKFQVALEEEKVKEQIREGRVKLTRSSEERRKLLRVLSHDLSNSIMAMSGHLMKMKRAIKKGEEVDKDKLLHSVDRVQNALKSQTEIIQLVRQNQVVMGGKKVSKDEEKVSVKELFKRSEDIFKQRFEQKKLKFIFDLVDDGDFFIKGSKVAISNHVINNLISNAIKFSYEGGLIRFRARRWGADEILISIEDHGVGIPKDLQDIIFDNDKKTSREGTSGEQGTGFGMPLVKAYVEKYSGKVEIISSTQEESPKGHGTMVRIFFKEVNEKEEIVKIAA